MALDSSSEPVERPLTPRQAAFVREYILDNNGTQAAIRAGYSFDTAAEQASRLLTDAKISGSIAQSNAHRLAAVNTTVEEVLGSIKSLAESDVNHYVISDEGQVELAEGAPPNAMKAIQSIKRKTRIETRGRGEDAVTTKFYDVELRLWDKPGSLKLMGKHAGVKACFDRVELTGPDGGPLITKIMREVVDPNAAGDS